MTREQAARLWSIIKAYSDGKIIEVNGKYTGWTEIPEPQFNDKPCEYRIKPEPHLRPWKPEEVPVGALIHNKLQPHQNSLILSNTDSLLQISYVTDLESITFNKALACCEYSLDHGITWKPCGVEE